MTHLVTIPSDEEAHVVIARLKMRRRVMAALLRHSPDGVWDDCYCGHRFPGDLLGGHIREMTARETGLPQTYVDDVMRVHRGAHGQFGGTMHCGCGHDYSDDFRSYGRDQHVAEALAANIDADSLFAALGQAIA
jgi:hypothetical protein